VDRVGTCTIDRRAIRNKLFDDDADVDVDVVGVAAAAVN
jgi:hypothetical protein